MIAWSWSRLDTFEACPLQFYHKNVIKSVPFTQSDAQLRGERIHKHMENALKGGPIHREVLHMQPTIDKLLSIDWDDVIIEGEHAYTKDKKKTTWFAKNVWLRIKQDYMARKGKFALCIDWKTGKNRGYSDQLKLYAGEAMHIWPEVTDVLTRYVFIDNNQIEPKQFSRDDFEHIWYDFENRVERIQIAEENGEWPTKPSSMACRFCPVEQCQDRR